MKLIARIVRGLPALWVWAVFVFLAFTLVPVVSEVMRFYELRRFFDLSVASGCYVLVVIISAGLIGIGVRQIEEKERRIHQLEKWEPPIIEGFQKLTRPEHMPIVQKLFRGHERITLKALEGGHENAGVFQISWPPYKDCVLKFAETKDVRAELRNLEKIRPLMSHAAADHFEDLHEVGLSDEDPGAIVYELAALTGPKNLRNFDEFYRHIPSDDRIGSVVTEFYTRVLPHCHDKRKGTLSLYHEYGRLTRKLDDIVEAVKAHPDIVQAEPDHEKAEVELPGLGRQEVRNPLHWVGKVFSGMEGGGGTLREVYVGTVHGDFHSRNILIELKGDQQNIWVIDFAHSRTAGHTLDDFCRLEADIKFVLTKVSEQDTPDLEHFFPQLLEFEKALLAPRERVQLHRINPFASDRPNRQLEKAWHCIEILRTIAAEGTEWEGTTIEEHLVKKSVYPYYLSLLHSTLPVMYYDEKQCNRWQKLYAFVSAALICESIQNLIEF